MQLAEALDARVTTNLKVGAAFPTDHPLHIGSPATFVTDDVIAKYIAEQNIDQDEDFKVDG